MRVVAWDARWAGCGGQAEERFKPTGSQQHCRPSRPDEQRERTLSKGRRTDDRRKSRGKRRSKRKAAKVNRLTRCAGTTEEVVQLLFLFVRQPAPRRAKPLRAGCAGWALPTTYAVQLPDSPGRNSARRNPGVVSDASGRQRDRPRFPFLSFFSSSPLPLLSPSSFLSSTPRPSPSHPPGLRVLFRFSFPFLLYSRAI